MIFNSTPEIVIFVCETWFHPDVLDSIFKRAGYNIFCTDRETHGGDVTIYIKSEIKCSIKSQSECGSRIEYLFMKLTTNTKSKVFIGCLYSPYRNIDCTNLMTHIEIMSLN